jgi:hypothetical protein
MVEASLMSISRDGGDTCNKFGEGINPIVLKWPVTCSLGRLGPKPSFL